MAELIINSIKLDKKVSETKKFRIHTSGDFFSQKYFDAWVKVAQSMPEKIFYAYTKSLKFWVNRLGDLPENFHLTASYGGKTDILIEKHNLKNTVIVFSLKEANDKGLEIDHDDTHCYDRNCTKFALLIHGTQPAGTETMKAIMKLRDEGIMGYNRNKQRV